MKLTAINAVLSVLALSLILGIPAITAQEIQSKKPIPDKPSPTQKDDDVVVLSGVATTARIADPDERVVFNGRVMRMADFVAAVSSSNEAVRHLHTQEKRNREKDQPTLPLKQTDSD